MCSVFSGQYAIGNDSLVDVASEIKVVASAVLIKMQLLHLLGVNVRQFCIIIKKGASLVEIWSTTYI
jgi:hypothetical protein